MSYLENVFHAAHATWLQSFIERCISAKTAEALNVTQEHNKSSTETMSFGPERATF